MMKCVPKAELEKIARLIEARELTVDMSIYVGWEYRADLALIYEDLEKRNATENLDDILVSVIGQINLMHSITVYNE